jgi:hypothetical protein
VAFRLLKYSSTRKCLLGLLDECLRAGDKT